VTTRFVLSGLHCGGCVKKATLALEALEGVDAVEVTLDPPRASVDGEVTVDAVVAALAAKAIEATPDSDSAPGSL